MRGGFSVKEIAEGGILLARTAARCKLDVVAAFPITPSTHIPQELSRIQPEHGYDFVPVESEFSALSVLIGASATGARTFTATSSQGLLLMHEALFNASGMRLPLVMVVANRAIGAPLNIWNDWQDSISQRDAGWIQLYCKNNQEAVDTLIQSFKTAEACEIPVMVCLDGFYLTHEVSPVDVPSQEEIASFLPKRAPRKVLDPAAPCAQGAYATPEYYQEFRRELHEALEASAKQIEANAAEFAKAFNRPQIAFVEETGKTGGLAVVTMGSLAEQCEMQAEAGEFDLVRLKCLRPFPREALARALKGRKRILVIEKSFSAGNEGALAIEVKSLLKDLNSDAIVTGAVTGLGGRDVSVRIVHELAEKAAKAEESSRVWV